MNIVTTWLIVCGAIAQIPLAYFLGKFIYTIFYAIACGCSMVRMANAVRKRTGWKSNRFTWVFSCFWEHFCCCFGTRPGDVTVTGANAIWKGIGNWSLRATAFVPPKVPTEDDWELDEILPHEPEPEGWVLDELSLEEPEKKD
ncbi:hypothetical protein ACYPKM_01490 [Pseudomonas aeruginosa]